MSERPPIPLLESRGAALWLLALASLFVLIPATGYWGPFTPLGDDASSHITTIATLSEALRSGGGWWSTDYNGGFPMGLYYQPLPHVASAIVAMLFGGPSAADETYKVLLIAMLAVQPWAVFIGLRRAGLGRLEAACAGVVTPLVLNGIEFGYHAQASLNVGLYTQAWGNVALPLAFGELAAIGRGRGRVLPAVLACAFVASTHMFFAIALVVPGLLFALVGRAWRRSVWQLPAVGVGAFGLLAAWLLPLATTQAFFGGWPFGRATRVDGYGINVVWQKLTSGAAMDADQALSLPFGVQVPVLMSLTVLGLLAAVASIVHEHTAARRKGLACAAVLLGWALIGFIGRGSAESPGFGALIDLYPMHKTVQLFRYGALVQFALVIFAGVGLATLGKAAARVHSVAGMIVLGVALFAPARAGVQQLDNGFRTIDDSGHFRPGPWQAAVDWLREDDVGGRMYVGKRSELRGHYHSGLMAWGARRPGAQSYGVGLHDSLHFYTLEYLKPDRGNALALADIFDFRTVVYSPRADLSGFGDLSPIYADDGYRVARLDVSGDAVAVMREGDTVHGEPRLLRRDIRAWMIGDGPATLQTVVAVIDHPRSREMLVGYPPAPEEARNFGPHDPVGHVLASEHVDSTFYAEVEMDADGLVVAKIGYHPFWRVSVDGIPAETVFAYPGFVAARVGPGHHTVTGEFRWPTYSRVLLFVSPLWLALAWVLDRRLRRSERSDRDADAPADSAAPVGDSPHTESAANDAPANDVR